MMVGYWSYMPRRKSSITCSTGFQNKRSLICGGMNDGTKNTPEMKISPRETVVNIYEAVMFHNVSDENHRLVFLPDIGNKMEQAYTSAVIRPDERWGAEFHGFGLIPYRCTIHPEERGEISIIL